jgi:hypothetical protein
MWKRTACIALIYALVRRSRRLDAHRTKLLDRSCHWRGGTRICPADNHPVANRLTPADFPHLRPYVEEMALCHEAETQALNDLAQAEYDLGMHKVKVNQLRDKHSEARCHTQQAHQMFDRMVNEMVAGVLVSEEDGA